MAVDKTRAPYYDDYDPTKKYTQILANPGRVEQSREFTQIQTMFMDFLRRGLNVFLSDGDVVEGCEITINRTTVNITAGKIYVYGIVHDVPASTVNIVGVGREEIGVVLKETVVTSDMDATLLDPAVGNRNYRQPGADRLKQELQFVANQPQAINVFTLFDGNVIHEVEKPQLDIITDLLAKRTFEESGNYRIEGLRMYAEDYPSDPTKILVNVDSGKAYVKGYDVVKSVTSRVFLDKSMDTRSILSEPATYYGNLSKYYLRNNPVKQVTRLIATIQVTQSIKRGNILGGTDILPRQPLVEVLEVRQLDTVYESGRDYQVLQDGISWQPSLPTSQEPERGASYTVTWHYNKLMEEGTDFRLKSDGQGYYIEFIGSERPVNGKLFNVDYDYYLSRIDRIFLTKGGEFKVLKGQPDIDRLVTKPHNSYFDMLPLASIKLSPNSNDIVIEEDTIDRTSMEDLKDIIARVEELEYNNALDELDNEAIAGEEASSLRGVFSEGFIGIDKADFNYDTNNITFSASIDLERGEMTLPTTMVAQELTINTRESNVKEHARLVTANYTEELAINQSQGTETMLVNPYQVYTRMGTVALNPASDNWIDTEVVNISQSRSVSASAVVRTNVNTLTSFWSSPDRVSTSAVGTTASTSSTRTSRMILDEAITFMRQRNVDVTVEGFLPNSDNITCLFDGRKVSLTSRLGTKMGTNTGTLKANADGIAYGSFTIPEGMRTGTKEITAYNDTARGSTSYTANGRRQVIQNTTTTTTTTTTLLEQTIFRTRVIPQPVDPLAQSFGFVTDRLLTSVGLFFATKDDNNTVTIQIRKMVNGTPSTEVLAEKVLQPRDVKVSEHGTLETKVVFDDLCYLENTSQYAITILTVSPLYSMFVAELGAKDRITGKVVPSQPYEAGVLFSSSNALTWTAHQTKDLKFKVYTAKFVNVQYPIVFNDVPVSGVDAYMSAIDSFIPTGTSINWEVKLEWSNQSGDSGWMPLYQFVQADTGNLPRKISVRGVFTTTEYLSPTIGKDVANLLVGATSPQATYISRTVTLDRNATTVKQDVELSIPSGTGAKVYFSVDDVNWIESTQTEYTPISQDFARYSFLTDLASHGHPGGSKTFSFRLDLTADDQTLRAKARKFLNIMK